MNPRLRAHKQYGVGNIVDIIITMGIAHEVGAGVDPPQSIASPGDGERVVSRQHARRSGGERRLRVPTLTLR